MKRIALLIGVPVAVFIAIIAVVYVVRARQPGEGPGPDDMPGGPDGAGRRYVSRPIQMWHFGDDRELDESPREYKPINLAELPEVDYVRAAKRGWREGTRVAVIPGTGNRAPHVAVPPLLEVALSHEKGISLLDRSQIKEVLREQALGLSGYVAPEMAAKVGRILAADVLVFVDNIPIEQKRRQPVSPTARMKHIGGEQAKVVVDIQVSCRIKVVDAKTGSVLYAREVSQPVLVDDISLGVRAVRTALEKLDVPATKRRTIGLMAFRSEEGGPTLDGAAEAVGMCLMDDLSRSPQLVVLEREQLDRFTTERELTGAERKLKASTMLIEGGLRRISGGQKLQATVVFRTLGARKGPTVSATGPADDLTAFRRVLAGRVAAKLKASPPPKVERDLKTEARLFAARWYPLYLQGDYDRSAQTLEAALALYPHDFFRRQAAHGWVSAACFKLHNTGSAMQFGARISDEQTLATMKSILLAARRAMELAGQAGSYNKHRFEVRILLSKDGLYTYTHEEGHPERKEVRELYDEWYAMVLKSEGLSQKELLRLSREPETTGARPDNPYAQRPTELDRLKKQIVRRLRAMRERSAQDRKNRAVDAKCGEPIEFITKGHLKTEDPQEWATKFKEAILRLESCGVSVEKWPLTTKFEFNPVRHYSSPEGPRTIIETMKWLAARKDPTFRMWVHRAVAVQSLDTDYARAVLDILLKEVPPQHPYRAGERFHYGYAAGAAWALQLLKREPETYYKYVQAIAQTMLHPNLIRKLAEFEHWLFDWLAWLDELGQTQVADKWVQAVEQHLEASTKKDGQYWHLHGEMVKFRTARDQRLGRRPQQLRAATPSDRWQALEMQRLPIVIRPDQRGHDRESAMSLSWMQVRGQELLLGWRRPDEATKRHTIQVTSTPLAGGRQRLVGQTSFEPKMLLATKFESRDPVEAMREFDQSLQRMKTDYVDFLMIHNIVPSEDLAALEAGVYAELRRLKEEGAVRFIGFSSMDSAEMSREAIERLEFDVALLAMNPTGYGGFVTETLPAARAKNMGVLAMKVMRDIVGGSATPAELLRYALSQEGVAGALVGHHGIATLEENIGIIRAIAGENGPGMASVEREKLESRMAHLAGPHALCWACPGYVDGAVG